MSNPEHLEKFRESIQIPNPLKLSGRIRSKTISENWDKWRKEYQDIEIDLSNEWFYGADLTEANLRKVNLKQVNLSNSDCSHADISFTNCNNTTFSGAILFKTNFTSANLIGAYLNDTKCNVANFYLANLTKANLEGTTLDFADLSFSNLTCTNFNGSKINKAKFIEADLRGANLQMCQALEADFTEANFTGACIQDWKINSDTKFDRVKCDFIYLQINEQERIPHNPKVNFKEGEFEKFITKAQNTVDLIFTTGIDWQAFLQAFLKLKSETGEELSINSIEDKWDNYFVVSINVPPDINKGKLAEALNRGYELKKDKRFLQQQIASLTMSVESLSEALRKKSMSGDTFNINANNSPVSIAKDNATQNIHAINEIFEQHQDISESAAEIQKLLTQLQNQGLSEKDAQEKLADELATKAKGDSTMMEKLKSLGKSFGSASGKALVTEVVKAVFKLALEKAGIHLE